MSRWFTPSRRMLTKAVATLVAVSFLFPTLAWSFDPQTYAGLPTQEVKLGGPGSEGLASEYRVSGNLGTMVEAGFAPGGYTYILVQDLHCHAEVQGNIRRMLNQLMERHPEIRLVAVEGGSGIIPTLELAAIPDSLPKRAVADYFMSEGKLTGADCLAICDRPQVEVFGAESLDLYTRSLELIQRFSTEENRGIVLEIQDQLEQAKVKHYNPALLAFDKKRQTYLRGGLEAGVYRKFLQQSIRELNGKLPEAALRDYHDLELQNQAFENVLWNLLTKSESEKQLAAYQKQLERAERIVNVSASRQDVLDYQAGESQLSLAAIVKGLQAELGDTGLLRPEDTAALEAAMKQSLQFYQLAEERNATLLNNALRRAQARGENRIVLVTGGFHTQSIIGLIKNQGHSYVALRPVMTQPDTTGNYYELLRNPRMATDLERMLAAAQIAGGGERAAVAAPAVGSIATANSVVNLNFRQAFRSGVAVANQVLESLKRPFVSAKYVKFRFNGEDFYATIYRGKFYLARHLAQLRWKTQDSAFSENSAVQIFRMTSTRIFGLLLGGAGLTMLMAAFATGIAVAPALVLTALGLTLAAISGGVNLGPVLQRVVTKTNIVLAAMVVGTLLVPMLGGPTLAEMLVRLAGATLSPASILHAMTSGFQNLVAALPSFIQNLTPAAQSAGSFSYSMATAFGVGSNVLIGPLFVMLAGMSMMMLWLYQQQRTPRYAYALAGGGMASVAEMKRQRDDVYTNMMQAPMDHIYSMTSVHDRIGQRNSLADGKDLFEETLEEQTAALKAQLAREREKFEERHGKPHDRSNPKPGSTVVVSNEMIVEAQDVIISNGLVNYESKTLLNITVKEQAGRLMDVMMPPVDSYQAVVNHPERTRSKLEIDVTDWVFQARDGKVPADYVRAVLNGLNPATSINVIAQADLGKYIAKAHETGCIAWVKKIIATLVLNWKKKEAPYDQATMEEYAAHSLVHEYVHGLILALPAGDIPEARRVELEKLTFEKYIDLVLRETQIHETVVAFKNLLKALKAVNTIKGPSSQYTRDSLMRIFSVEMFCDRFAMYLMENHEKNKLYADVFGKMQDSEFADYGKVDAAEAERKNGRLGQYLAAQGVRLAPAQVQELEAKLKATETAHFFIRKYGDTPITDNERAFFQPFLKLLRHFDQEDTIAEYTPEHAQTSTVMRIQPLLASASSGVGRTVVAETTKTGLPTGLAVAAGKALLGQNEESVAIAQETSLDMGITADTTATPEDDFFQSMLAEADQAMVGQAPAEMPSNETTLLSNAHEGVESTSAAAVENLDLNDMASWLNETVSAPDIQVGVDQETLVNPVLAMTEGQVFSGTEGYFLNTAPSSGSQSMATNIGAQQTGQATFNTGVTGSNYGMQLGSGDNWNDTPIPPAGDPPRNPFPNLRDGDRFSQTDILNAMLATSALNPGMSMGLIHMLAGIEQSPAAQASYKVGFDSRQAAERFQADLQKMAASDSFYAALAGKMKVTAFPSDSTGQPVIDKGWDGITVLTAPVKPNRSTILIETNGDLSLATHRPYISREAAEKYLADSSQWQQLREINDAILKQMTNAADLEQQVFFLDLNRLTDEQRRLLGHLVRNDVEGIERISRDNELFGYAENLRAIIHTNATNQVARTSRVRVTVDLSVIKRLRQLSEQGASVVQMKPVSGVVSSAKVSVDLESSLVASLAGKNRLVGNVPLAALVDAPEVSEPLSKDTEARREQDLREVRAQIDAVMGEKYSARNLSDQQLESMIDNLNSLAKVTVLWSDPSLLAAGRMHAKEYQQNTIWKIQWGKRAERPVVPIGEWEPEVKTTQYMTMKGGKKVASSLLLAVAAGIMVMRSSGQVFAESKGRRLQLLNYLNLPAFLKALRIMILIVQGRVDKALKEMPISIRQQVTDIQREAQSLDKLKQGEAPASLRYALNGFQSLIRELLKNWLFRAAMRVAGVNEQTLMDLYPEIFMLLSQSEELRNVVYYVSPAMSIRAQILGLEGSMDPALFKALTADPATAGMELTRLRAELREAMNEPAANADRIAGLQRRIDDLRLTVGMDVALNKLSAERPDSERKLARVLISQLGRPDITDNVRKDILKLLSMITPFQQTAVQIRLDETGEVVQTTLPAIVVNSLVRNQLLNHVAVYDQNGQPLEEIQRPISYASMA